LYFQEYDVRQIVASSRNGSEVVDKLDRDGFVHGAARKVMVNALIAHLLTSVKK
jgi:hypothetical protein